jgi:hypothetical protein
MLYIIPTHRAGGLITLQENDVALAMAIAYSSSIELLQMVNISVRNQSRKE